MNLSELKPLLDSYLEKYESKDFVPDDPISIPHRFTKKQDIEIIGFWIAILAWGNRKSIINSGEGLLERMDGAPHDFILHHKERDRKRFLDFKHRTFNATDALYFLEFLQQYYRGQESLEPAFARHLTNSDEHVGPALVGFHDDFFSLPDFPPRTRKHIATPARKSACKRLNMFLRWMVRDSAKGVDFGLWKTIKASQLLCPLDVHVERVARKLGLIQRKQRDFQTVLELSSKLTSLDPNDPVKYDLALFGMSLDKYGL